jgi:hypothetical protein
MFMTEMKRSGFLQTCDNLNGIVTMLKWTCSIETGERYVFKTLVS